MVIIIDSRPKTINLLNINFGLLSMIIIIDTEPKLINVNKWTIVDVNNF